MTKSDRDIEQFIYLVPSSRPATAPGLQNQVYRPTNASLNTRPSALKSVRPSSRAMVGAISMFSTFFRLTPRRTSLPQSTHTAFILLSVDTKPCEPGDTLLSLPRATNVSPSAAPETP